MRCSLAGREACIAVAIDLLPEQFFLDFLQPQRNKYLVSLRTPDPRAGLGCYRTITSLNELMCVYNKRLRCVAQPGSALAWGARGRRFESFHTDHMNQGLSAEMP